MERADQPRGKQDDNGIDDKQEEPHAEDGEGKGNDDEDGTDETVEQGNDDGGEDSRTDRVDLHTWQDVGRQDGAKGHHHGLCQKAEFARIKLLVVVDGYLHEWGLGCRSFQNDQSIRSIRICLKVNCSLAVTNHFQLTARTVDNGGGFVFANAAVNPIPRRFAEPVQKRMDEMKKFMGDRNGEKPEKGKKKEKEEKK